MDPLAFLSEHPGASRKQVMKACGCSARDVRRAEEQLRLQGAASTNRGVVLLAAGAVTILVLAGLLAAPIEAPSSAKVALAPDPVVEAAIYSALDARDPSRVGEALGHLESEREELRLAALRYLGTVDPEPHLDRIVARASDSSPRVRVAAIQLLGKVKPRAVPGVVEEELVMVLLNPERDLAERIMAQTGLIGRRIEQPTRLLPLLDDPRFADATHRLLVSSYGQVAGEESDPKALRAAWARALEGRG